MKSLVIRLVSYHHRTKLQVEFSFPPVGRGSPDNSREKEKERDVGSKIRR